MKNQTIPEKMIYQPDRIFETIPKYLAVLSDMATNYVLVAITFALTFILEFLEFLKTSKFINTYIFHDWQLAGFLAILFAMDTFFGTLAAVIRHRKGLEKFKFEMIFDIIGKSFVYMGVLVVAHIFQYFTVDNERQGCDFISKWVCIMLIAYEARSVAKNMSFVYPKFDLIVKIEGTLSKLIDKATDKLESKIESEVDKKIENS